MNRRHVKAIYPYADADGVVIYRKVRYEFGEDPNRTKSFEFMRPDPDHAGQSISGLGDLQRTLYRLPELRAADSSRLVLFVEGEKAVDYLLERGYVATTAGSVSDWRPGMATEFKNRNLVVIADNDEVGRRAAHRVASDCSGIAGETRVVELDGVPPGGGLDDWFSVAPDLHTRDMLWGVTQAVPEWKPAREDSSTWIPIDLLSLLEGDLSALEPTQLERSDGVCILYPGRVHDFHGEPETLKSWTAQIACAAALRAGGTALYIDCESEGRDVVGHLVSLGVSHDAILRGLVYIRPDQGLTADAREGLLARLSAKPPLISVIDGVNSALAAGGYEPNSNGDVRRWWDELVRPVQRATGGATILIDHVTKSKEFRGRWAVGAGQKLAGIDGASFGFELIKPFGHGRSGMAVIELHKDRPGALRGRVGGSKQVAQLLMESSEDGSVTWDLQAPTMAEDGTWRPTGLMEKVSRFLEDSPEPVSQRAIERSVQSKLEYVRKAIRELVAGDFVEVTRGPHSSNLHRSLRPYRQHVAADEQPQLPCPKCGGLAFSFGPDGPPERRCHLCEHIWSPLKEPSN